MLKQIIVLPSVLLIALTTNALPSHAQRVPGSRSLITLGRAENLAREAAEKANGGLQNYRAENSMYGPAQSSPHIYDGHGTWTFSFKGHRPDSRTPTVKSVVTVSRSGIVNVNYNGPIR
ncbi:MAG: hypothetical protein PUP93_12770 [Rhizonema sp. NSF051]|nr:hypothetical protein [Rhizonema sp. NSF051]